jgi:hypothetical protein
MRRFFSAGIIVVWLVLVGMLIAEQNAPLDEHRRLAPMAGEGGARDEWFGVYREEHKVGWVHRTLSRSPEGWIVRDDSELRLAMLGTAQRLRTSLIAETDEAFGLRRFRFGLVSPAATFRAQGEVGGNLLRIQHGTGSATDVLELELPGPIQLPSTQRNARPLWEAEPGDKFRTPVFSPLTMQYEDILVEVGARTTMDGPEGEVEALELLERHQGLAARAWIARDGSTLAEQGGLGFRLVRESADAASRGLDDSAPIDLATESRIPFEGELTAPRNARLLRLKVEGEAAGRIPQDPPRQIVREGVLEVRLEDPGGTEGFSSPGPTEEDRLPSLFVESDDPDIRARARSIVGQEVAPDRRARLLVDWVHENLEQTPSVTLPSARAVLASGRGDCNEHAVLLAALARAVDIPARVVTGVVYADGGFFYHAWNEFWLGRWMSADAIFGQLPTDATHIKFLEGGPERHLELAEIVGRVRFSPLEQP